MSKQINGMPAGVSAEEDAGQHIPWIYVAVALLIATLLAIVTPPFIHSDEGAHAERAIAIGHGQWIAPRLPEGIGGPMDVNLVTVVDSFRAVQEDTAARYPIARTRPDGRFALADLIRQRNIFWARQAKATNFANTAAYPAILYLPQIVAWHLAESANLTIFHSLLLARLSAAFFSIAVGWLALRLCRMDRWLLFAYLLLPTVLSLTASCSQDALLVSVSALAAALLSRAIAERREMTMMELVWCAVLLMACTTARSPYLLLAPLLLLPALQSGGSGWRRFLAPGIAMLFVVASLGAWEIAAKPETAYSGPSAIAPPNTGNMAGVDARQQVVYLLAHPVRGAVSILAGTVRLAPSLAVKATYSLGWNDIYPPWSIYALLFLGLAGLCLLSSWQGIASWQARLLLMACLLAVILGISFAEYLIWTPVGSHKLAGPAGRYYLPLVPFALLLSSEGAADQRSSRRMQRYRFAAVTFLLAVVLSTPLVAAQRFYRSGIVPVIKAVLG